MRDNPDWKEYLEFDFLSIVRINQLKFDTVSSQRQLQKVMIQQSNVPDFFEDLKEVDVTGNSVDIMFDSPVMARLVRIVVIKASMASADSLAIAIQK